MSATLHSCLSSEMFSAGAEGGERGREARLQKLLTEQRLLTGASVPENGDKVQLRLAGPLSPCSHSGFLLGVGVEILWGRLLQRNT